MYSIDEVRANISDKVSEEGRRRIDNAGPSSPRLKDLTLMRAIRIVRRENKNKASSGELQKLNALEELSVKIEETEELISNTIAWVNSAGAEELESFDHVDGIEWPL